MLVQNPAVVFLWLCRKFYHLDFVEGKCDWCLTCLNKIVAQS